jgi:hypothetical protein
MTGMKLNIERALAETDSRSTIYFVVQFISTILQKINIRPFARINLELGIRFCPRVIRRGI